MKAPRREVRALLETGRFDKIRDMAHDYRGLLGSLVPHTYDPDPRIAWRAVHVTGLAADAVMGEDPDLVREHLRRLLWLITEESGGICWRAPELMAAVVSRRPREFGEYVPIITHLLLEMAEEDLEHFRAGILWAIGRLGPPARHHAFQVLPAILDALDRDDPTVRGTAAWCLGRLGLEDELRSRPGLRADSGTLELFQEGDLKQTTVARIVRGFTGGEPGGS